MLKGQTRESLIAKLQAYRQHAEENRNFEHFKDDGKRRPYFRNHPPEVRDEAWKQLDSLCIKHRAKLEARPSFIGILVPVATRLALDKLGLRQISRKGFHRLREINRIKVDLGIRDKNPNDVMNNRRKRAKAAANMQKCNVSQLPLEC